MTLTVACMNALLSGAAERGDVNLVLKFWHDDYSRNDLVPNADTLSFVFESLGKNLRRLGQNDRGGQPRKPSADAVDASIVAADSFLTRMEDLGIEPTHHIVREYVEMLCLAEQVDTATAIVLESVQEQDIISDKTLYRVAMSNAKIGEFDLARQVASSRPGGEPIHMLDEAIEREESILRSGEMEASQGSNQSEAGSFWKGSKTDGSLLDDPGSGTK